MYSGGGRRSASREVLARTERTQVSEADMASLRRVALHEDAARAQACSKPDDSCTVFLRNLPVRCTEDEVIRTLTELGWGGDIASITLPLRPAKPGRAHHNRGYGFVYFQSPVAARAFLIAMVNGFRISTRSSSKVVLVEFIRGSGSREGSISDVIGVGMCATSSNGSSSSTQTPSIADRTSQSRSPNLDTVQWLQL
eukprot:TRINITY_DN1157_c0_g1_i5.p1 TRINITY_DN1157_c0_g1~~TRINITY_DN1157_c0_g1_i5.p1  ORF type:complete len:197 (+),score=20.09 TRINITY_DN1157_c0_g1_i5:76-666(+)